MHEKIKELELAIVEGACTKMKECGFSKVSTEEMGEITDMLKDLSEARYYDSIVDAMGVPDEPEMSERMGYDNWRYASGRFAPKGRGTRSGYVPMYSDDYSMGYSDGDMSYNGSQSRSNGSSRPVNTSNRRMGYTEPTNRLGRSYDEYSQVKRSYQTNQTAENRRNLENKADKHLDEVIDTFREIWADVDQPMRVKMQNKLADFVNEELNV